MVKGKPHTATTREFFLKQSGTIKERHKATVAHCRAQGIASPAYSTVATWLKRPLSTTTRGRKPRELPGLDRNIRHLLRAVGDNATASRICEVNNMNNNIPLKRTQLLCLLKSRTDVSYRNPWVMPGTMPKNGPERKKWAHHHRNAPFKDYYFQDEKSWTLKHYRACKVFRRVNGRYFTKTPPCRTQGFINIWP